MRSDEERRGNSEWSKGDSSALSIQDHLALLRDIGIDAVDLQDAQERQTTGESTKDNVHSEGNINPEGSIHPEGNVYPGIEMRRR
eukprot:704192-Pyramimonas_sp.AAC.1